MNIRPLLFALTFLLAAPIARACGECEKEYQGHHAVECVPIPNCKPAADSNGSQLSGEGKAAKTDLTVEAQKALKDGYNGGVVDQTRQPQTSGHHGAQHVDNTEKGPVETEVPPYQRVEALNHIREQFDNLRTEFADNPRRLKIVNATQVEFEKRLKGIPGETFPQQEVNALDDMYREQMDYSRELHALKRQRERLGPEEFQKKMDALDVAHAKKMSDIHVHGGEHSELVTALHASIDTAVRDVCRDGCRPNPAKPDDWVPSGAAPGRHTQDMQSKFGNDPTVLEMSARDKLAAGNVSGGLADLNKAIANGGTADAYGMRGGVALDKKDYQAAYLDAKKALELNPGDKALMGLLKSAEGRVSPEFLASVAAGGARSAGAMPGSGASNGGGGASGYAGSGGFASLATRDVAGMTSSAVLASNSKLDEARRAMAIGDFAGAVAAAQRALELNPSNAAAHAFLSIIYASRGDYAKAIASASAGLALSPHDAALLGSKAYAENRAKRYRDALGTSNAAIEADPRNPYGYAYRGHAYGGLGDKDAMMSDLNRAASMDPRFAKAAADASQLQLPSSADILFMFPGEDPVDKPVAAAAPRRSFGLVLGAGLLGGLLLALGLLSTVLAPVKDSVVSAFTKITRRGPSLHELEQPAEEAASGGLAAGAAAGLIRGQYEISRQIGAGGMGTVYEGTDRSLGRRVAIKKMRDELRVNARERDRFVIEAKTVASLHHPNIVDIYSIVEEAGDVYLVFEYVEGQTVHDVIQAKGRLRVEDAARVTRAVADALAYAHAHGVIHRDMKPSNVMVNPSGVIKVMDFGIARLAKDALTRYSMTNTVVGTPPYMAPEQEQGVVRKESDVYSLAICAYEMLTGKLPFIGVAAGMLMNKINMSYIPPSRAIAGLPETLDEVFAKAFQADPEKRYRTPQEFAAALERALGGSVRAS